ncbi:MAG TPA: hypothetical protein VFO82_16665, partial [Steroidobacteraceae bacterium]|nr:hypothetical protein [Steroidobacteraceae bacterium]
MKSESHSLTALRASRLLSCVALTAALGVLSVRLYDAVELGNYLALVMTPQSALCIATLALAALAVSVPRSWAQRLGQLLAVLSCAFALPSGLAASLDAWLATAPLQTPPVADVTGLSGAASIMYSATALALFFVPLRGRLGTQLFATFAALGLLATATSLIGMLLDSPTLASLGFAHLPTVLANVMAGLLLLATLALRRDAGWLSVLLGPTAAGSSARGIIAWTVLAPLTFAALALAGVREGIYSLHFAFALLAAAMCCGLTALVMWN